MWPTLKKEAEEKRKREEEKARQAQLEKDKKAEKRKSSDPPDYTKLSKKVCGFESRVFTPIRAWCHMLSLLQVRDIGDVVLGVADTVREQAKTSAAMQQMMAEMLKLQKQL